MWPRLYLCPIGMVNEGVATAPAASLAGGWTGFLAYRVALRGGSAVAAGEIVPVSEIAAWVQEREPQACGQLESSRARLSSPRPPWAGLTMDRPHVMGVINVTPDSFSDGGDRLDCGRATEDGLAMVEAGAALIDVGGESTRPGADAIPVEEELARVIPVVRRLAEAGALVSIDTRRAVVMRAAIESGARVVNDITALSGDADSMKAVAASGVAVVLMHMQGEPRTMQANPAYENAALDIYDFLEARIAACEQAGIGRERIAADPGIGFGKTARHNLEILSQLAVYHGLGCPIVLGASRKSFIGRLSRGEPPKLRVPGSLAVAMAGLAQGVQIVRAHDVPETVQALAVWQAIATAGGETSSAVVG